MKRAIDLARLMLCAGPLWAPAALAQLAQNPAAPPQDVNAIADDEPMTPPDGEPSVVLLRSTRDALIRAGDFTGALMPAEGVVAGLKPDDPQLALQLMVLARIRTEVGKFEAAEADYLRALDLLEQRDGELAISLVDPYQALARTYIKNHKYDEAITALDAARHITQRNLGLFSLEQIELLDDMTIALLRAGDTAQAQRTQEERLNMAIRHFGENDSQVIPFRYQLANYYDRSRMRQHAREQYNAILATQETLLGSTSPELLRPLRELVQVDILTGEDSGARGRLTDILAANDDIAPRQRARALVALGDWDMVHNSISAGIDYYRQAYTTFHTDPEAQGPFMAQPTLIDFVPPLSPVDRRAGRRMQYAWGTIALEFNVSADARIADVKVVSSEPAGVMDDAYTRRLLETHVRPRLVDGEPVATSGVQLAHYFRYYVEAE